MNNELKPCPFCGGQPQMDTFFDNAGKIYRVWCTNCHIHKDDFSEEAAIAAWNKREYSWDLLMDILDEVYPADVFNGSSGDVGPRIIMKLREIDLLRQEENEEANDD